MEKLKNFIEDIWDWIVVHILSHIFVAVFSPLEKHFTKKRMKKISSWYELPKAVSAKHWKAVTKTNDPFYYDWQKYYFQKKAIPPAVPALNDESEYFELATPLGYVTEDFFKKHKNDLFVEDFSYFDEPKSYDRKDRRIRNKNWKIFKSWQKRILFNDGDKARAKISDYDKVNQKWARMHQIWQRAFPSPAYISGYTEPAMLPCYIEDVLTSFAVYMFYFSHVASYKQQIRECWRLRKEVRKLENFDDEEFFKVIESITKEYEPNHFYKRVVDADRWLSDEDGLVHSHLDEKWIDVKVTSANVNLTRYERYDQFATPDDRFIYAEIDGDTAEKLEAEYKKRIKDMYKNRLKNFDKLKTEVFTKVAISYEKLWD